MLISFDVLKFYHYQDNLMPVNTRKTADLKDEILS